jgi:hypothetical protein
MTLIKFRNRTAAMRSQNANYPKIVAGDLIELG